MLLVCSYHAIVFIPAICNLNNSTLTDRAHIENQSKFTPDPNLDKPKPKKELYLKHVACFGLPKLSGKISKFFIKYKSLQFLIFLIDLK